MKKGIILFGILAVLFLFTACGAKEDIDNSENVLAESIGQTEKNSTEKSSESTNEIVPTISATESKDDLSAGSVLVAEQILTGTDGDIHYSYYLPGDFDESRKYPMMVVMPGYDMMWFGEDSSGSNLNWRGFLAWTELDEGFRTMSILTAVESAITTEAEIFCLKTSLSCNGLWKRKNDGGGSMKRKTFLKIVVDIGMTVMLLFLMTYELIGAAAHEWLGMGMFVLFITHHILNRKWSQCVFKGRYTLFRIWQTTLVIGILMTMIGSMYSGIILSEHALSFLPIKGGRAFAREVHMISSYWGFVLMSLHLGLHWSMIMGMAKRLVKEPPTTGKWLLRGTAALIAGYGVYAFIQRGIGQYMLLRNHFAFFDFEEPLIFFLADYMAVMALFVCVSHYFSKGLRYIIQTRKIK